MTNQSYYIMKTRMCAWIACIALALPVLIQGCAPDKKYNLEDMDSEITVLKGISMPLPNLQEIKLGDLIKIDASSGDVLSINAAGEYVVSFSMEPSDIKGFSIEADALTLSTNGGSSTPQSIGEYTSIPANTPLDYDSADRDALAAYLDGIGYVADMDMLQKQDFLTQNIDYSFDADFTIDDFPKEVSAIKSADITGSINLKILPDGIPFSKLLLRAGSKIVFPDFIRLSDCSNSSFTIQGDSHTLLANADIIIPVGTGLELDVAVIGLYFGENGVAPSAGKLPLQSSVKIEDGKITLDPMDFTGATKVVNYPKNPSTAPTVLDGSVTVVESDTPITDFTFGYSYTVGINSVSSVILKLSDDAAPSFDSTYGFDIQGLPDILTGADVKIELAELQLELGVDSKLPFNFDLSGKLQALDASGPISGREYPIGPLTFKKESKTTYSLGEKADGEADGVIYKHVQDLGKILSPLPTRVEANNFAITFPKDWLEIPTGKQYGAQMEVSLDAPLSFTAGTALSLGIDLDVNLDMTSLGKGLPNVEAVLEFKAANTVPLSFGVTATALDEDKNGINSVTSTIDGDIKAGKIGAPSSNDIKITLSLDPSKKVSAIRIGLDASSNAEVAGTRLNKDQGITLTDLHITLPNGVTADIKELTQTNNK